MSTSYRENDHLDRRRFLLKAGLASGAVWLGNQTGQLLGAEEASPLPAMETGPVGGVVPAKKQGKVRYVGFTGHTSPDLHFKMLQQG